MIKDALSESTLISEKRYSKKDYSLALSRYFEISLSPSLRYCVIKNSLNMSRKSTGTVKHVDELKLVNENSIKKLVADAMKIWESEHLAQITALKAEIEELRSSQEFNSAKYDDLVTECKELKKINKLQEQEIMKLKSQSMKLRARGDEEEEKVDAIEQYGRRRNLEISGIPIKDGKNTNKIMGKIAKLVNVELSADKISISSRLAVKPKRTACTENGINTEEPQPPSIIVHFLSRDVCNQIYRSRKLLRKADLKNFSVKGTRKSSSMKI